MTFEDFVRYYRAYREAGYPPGGPELARGRLKASALAVRGALVMLEVAP